MNIRVWFVLVSTGICFTARAAIIFSQDFSSSTDLSSYVSGTPNSGQWNDITGGTLNATALRFDRPLTSSSSESFTRSTDFDPAPGALIYRFTLTVGPRTTAARGAAVWQVGSGFSPTRNGPEPAANVQSQFGINFVDSWGGYTFRDVRGNQDSQGTSFSSGPLAMMWVVNHSGATIEYQTPIGDTATVGNNQWDLWAGYRPLFDNASATTATDNLTDLKFAYTGGQGWISMDNFSVEDIGVVPELPETGLLASIFAGLLVVVRHWRRRKSP